MFRIICTEGADDAIRSTTSLGTNSFEFNVVQVTSVWLWNMMCGGVIRKGTVRTCVDES